MINAKCTQAVGMATATAAHGNVFAIQIGVAFYATKVISVQTL